MSLSSGVFHTTLWQCHSADVSVMVSYWWGQERHRKKAVEPIHQYFALFPHPCPCVNPTWPQGGLDNLTSRASPSLSYAASVTSLWCKVA